MTVPMIWRYGEAAKETAAPVAAVNKNDLCEIIFVVVFFLMKL